jgi:hypothetical protein
MSNYAQMLIERLGKPDAKTPLRPDQLRYASLPGVESVTGAKHMAYLLFMVIREHHGDAAARAVFALWGTTPSAARLHQIANIGLLDRLDMMKPKPNVQRLAWQLAKENKAIPRSKQRGAGSTNPTALEKQIRRQVRERDDAMKAGTWLGPFPPDDIPGHSDE